MESYSVCFCHNTILELWVKYVQFRNSSAENLGKITIKYNTLKYYCNIFETEWNLTVSVAAASEQCNLISEIQ